MKQQIFDNSISPKCRNCQFGESAADGKIILCEKSGVRAPDDACKKYRYDPLRREPDPRAPEQRFSDKDFSLEL